ncbi:MAG: type II secretion system ATPase GspE [Pseudomonadota bacterium]
MPPEPAFNPLPYSYAKRHRVLVQSDAEGQIELVFTPETSTSAIVEAQRKAGRPTQLHEMQQSDFDTQLARFYESGQATSDIIDDLGDEYSLSTLADALPEPEDLMESSDDAPVIRLINAILTQAIRDGASDIHIEPFEKALRIRYRVDGVMLHLYEPPREIAPLIISRIKVMSKLDIAEKRVPQDGRISVRVAGRPVDVRVSTLPSGHGERVVMRLLDKQAGRLRLEKLGMADHALDMLREILGQPHGILLVTGPTGSGKTTSLYAALTELNDGKSTILTVEDPVEYYIDGIGQTQVNPKVDLDFARGLRAILRQDPNIVMVGEIRDLETAEIAVQASLTGHLVLSTLHTNTAVGAVTRLRDMGVEPFLLSSSLIGVVAQRLVRVLCNHCKRPHEPSDSERELLGIHADDSQQLHTAVGCEHCKGEGYQGRSGVYEVVVIDNALRNMIHDGASEHELEQHARSQSQSMFEDGKRRVLAGQTSLEEVLRVTRES